MIRSYRSVLVISLFLTLATIAVFWQLPGHDFVTIDDNVYVTNNPYVDAGLTAKSIRWAFTTVKAEFWHPLTWLSLMADTQIFGSGPAGYHFTNLLLHILNTLLLFFFLRKASGNLWQSGFAASLFALHPLHVESVAWIAQRKDVLSTFFWLLTLWRYARFVEQPNRFRYGWVLVFFILGLMSKPMLLTLPFILLLLDYWPFCRFQYEGSWRSFIRAVWPYIREKLPFFGIAAAAAIVTYMAQKYGGGLDSLSPYPLSARMANALISYGVYIWKMIWPQNLAFFYPFPGSLPIWQMTAAALALGLVTALAIKSIKDRPYIIVGWLWYLGTLLPVIGLVKIGDFAMADRYTYVPLIGLFIIISWGVPDALEKWRSKTWGLTLAAIVVLAGLAAVTWVQARCWSNSIALYEHAIQVTRNNFLAHYALGDILAGKGKFEEAISHLSEAVKIRPDKTTLRNDLGRALASQGKLDESMPHFLEALRINPRNSAAHYYLGNAFAIQGHGKKAIYHFSQALRLNSDLTQDRSETVNRLINQAELYSNKEEYDKALALYKVNTSAEKLQHTFLGGYRNWELLERFSK
jgi:tetratricopeptide (TPR) repeat protein